MKVMTSVVAASVVLLSTGVSTPAVAAAHKPSRMSCEEFVALDEVARPKILYWTEGFNQKGEPTGAVAHVAEIDQLVPMVVEECQKTPKASFNSAIAKQKAASKPATTKAAAQPAKMTCKEFVALDDVTKPKIVYWAEGLNKHGKLEDTVVDVERTDRLVPVLVDECKAAPEESFWQKVRKHF